MKNKNVNVALVALVWAFFIYASTFGMGPGASNIRNMMVAFWAIALFAEISTCLVRKWLAAFLLRRLVWATVLVVFCAVAIVCDLVYFLHTVIIPVPAVG